MMLAIAIILGIAMILNIKQTEGNYNVLMAAALCISLYNLSLILFWIVLVFLILVGINWYMKNN
jgi:hypothetical protein